MEWRAYSNVRVINPAINEPHTGIVHDYNSTATVVGDIIDKLVPDRISKGQTICTFFTKRVDENKTVL
jgi:hypothetical protein